MQIQAMRLQVTLHALRGIKCYHNARSQGKATTIKTEKLKRKITTAFMHGSGSEVWFLRPFKSIPLSTNANYTLYMTRNPNTVDTPLLSKTRANLPTEACASRPLGVGLPEMANLERVGSGATDSPCCGPPSLICLSGYRLTIRPQTSVFTAASV